MFLQVACALLTIGPFSRAQLKPISVDWAFDIAPRVYNSIWFQWTKDHELLVRDPAKGGFLSVDPNTGLRVPIGDSKIMESSLAQAGGPRLNDFEAPLAISPDGRSMAFDFRRELYVLDIASSRFRKVAAPAGLYLNVTFSPDSATLGFVLANDLYTAPVSNLRPVRLTHDGAKNVLNGVLTWVYWEEIYNHHDAAYWWSNDSKYIAFLHTDESNVPPSVVVDFRGQYPATISQCYPKPGNPNPKVNLGVVAASGGKAVWMNPLSQADGYVTGVKWSSQGDPSLLYQVLDRAQTNASIWQIGEGALSAKPSNIFSESDPKYIDVNDDFDLFDGGKQLLFASGRSGYEQFYTEGVGQPDARELTAKADWQVLPAEIFDPATVAYFDQKGGQIFFICDRDSYQERQLYRESLDGSGLTRISKGAGSHDPVFSPDGQFYVDTYSSRQSPPTTTLNRADGAELQTLAAPDMSVMSQVDAAPVEPIEIPARDGFKLPATLLKPRETVGDQRYPAIVEIYGGPEAPTVSNEWDDDWAQDQVYAADGYVVLHVDCRSATVIDRHLADALKGHFYGEGERNDFVDAAEWLKKQPFVDPNRIGIEGWSGGGGNVLNCVCRTTEFKAAIAGAPYLDPSLYDTFYSEHLFGLPKDDPQDYANAPIWKDASGLSGKLLLMWGSADDNVHPQNELKFLDECIKAGKLVQVMIFPGRKHGLGDPAADRYKFETSLAFWKANL